MRIIIQKGTWNRKVNIKNPFQYFKDQKDCLLGMNNFMNFMRILTVKFD